MCKTCNTQELSFGAMIRDDIDEPLEQSVNVDSVPIDGQKQIERMIASQLNAAGVRGWPANTQHETYRGELLNFNWDYNSADGRLSKRFARMVYKTTDVKLPADVLSEIGNLANNARTAAETVNYTIADSIDWDAGDFGDDGSCYWSENRGARDVLIDNGGLAVKLFRDNDFIDGCGRAWLAPYRNSYIVFNGYGTRTTREIAGVLARQIGCAVTKVRLSNYGCGGGLLYINSSSGYYLGDDLKNDGDSKPAVDLEWDTDGYRGAYLTCSCCGSELEENEQYSHNDELYCEQCFYERYSSCESCGEIVDSDEIVETPANPNAEHSYSQWCCESCADDVSTCCEGCATRYHDNATLVGPDDERYCEDCYCDRFFYCEKCNCDCDNSDARNDCENGETICADCALA